MPTLQKPTLNPALKDFWKTKAPVKVLKGGRSSSKTWDAAGFSVFLAAKYRLKFLCVRQFQNKISESVYAVIVLQIERFGLLDQFDVLKSVIRHKQTGSEFHFYGINRNIKEIKGFEGADVCWIEEGEGLTQEQWRIIEPTLRKGGSECWLIYNPYLVSDFVETEFKHDPENGVIVRVINYTENAFLSDTILQKINRLKDRDYASYEHIYLGVPLSDDDHVVIKRSWIMAAIDAHEKLGIEIAGSKRIGFDIADDGKDLCAQVYAHGIVALWGENWKAGEDELLESCKRVYGTAVSRQAEVTYDSIGVGAHAGSKFKELNTDRKLQALSGKIRYKKFIAGGKVIDPDGYYIDTEEEQITNRDFFSNLKAQAWWTIADRFRNTYNAVTKGEIFPADELISVSSDMPNLDNLITQLSTPKRDFAKDGRVKVESKEDLEKRGVDSPNDADAFVMAFAPDAGAGMEELLKLAIGA